jgi:hypothetical protein
MLQLTLDIPVGRWGSRRDAFVMGCRTVPDLLGRIFGNAACGSKLHLEETIVLVNSI